MKKLFKNNYGVASPIEFTIASMALISTLVVVSASMAPSVEQASAQFYADANAKATEIMSLLLTSNSEVGLVTDPGTPVPIPPSESITDITIWNSRPYAYEPNPPNNAINVPIIYPNKIVISVYVKDNDEDIMNVSFWDAKNTIGNFSDDTLIGRQFPVSNGPVSVNWTSISLGRTYSWYVNVSDLKSNYTSETWRFTTRNNRPPDTPSTPSYYLIGGDPFEGYVGVYYNFKTVTTDPEGDNVCYWWDWGDGTDSGTYGGWDGPYNSGIEVIASHKWISGGTFDIKVKAIDDPWGRESGWSTPLTITIHDNDLPFIAPAGDPSTGPNTARCGIENWEYTTVAGDNDIDNRVRIGWDWNNDGIVDEFSNYQNVNPHRATHVFGNPGDYEIRVIPQDIHGAYGDWSTRWLTVTVSGSPPPNDPPRNPEIPSGPINVEIGSVATYSTTTQDPFPIGDTVRIGWDWDSDRIVDKWTSYIGSPYSYSTSHTWIIGSLPGDYFVSAIAEDRQGVQSDWSESLKVKVTTSPPTCFLAGTKIEMVDGTQKNIEDIQIGDIVKSYDINTDSIQNDVVVEVHHDTPNQMKSNYYLVINNDLKITPDHPVYIDSQWISAEKLKIGDILFKGKISSLEKIYEKVSSYNFETEKYHTYLVVFGDNIIIAHNGRTYILTGNEEEISLSRQSSVTENDYAALLSMDKIFILSDMSYQELKEILGVSDEYEFSITIQNSEAIYLNYMPDKFISLNPKNVVVTCKENVIIADSVGYAYATISVTVIK